MGRQLRKRIQDELNDLIDKNDMHINISNNRPVSLNNYDKKIFQVLIINTLLLFILVLKAFNLI